MFQRTIAALSFAPKAVAAVLSLALMGAQPASSVRPITTSTMPAAEHAAIAPAIEVELLHDVVETIEPAVEIPAVAPHHVIHMEVTAYCACTLCCGPNAQGLTASGKDVEYNNGQFVAADAKVFHFGQKLIIPGYAGNQPVEVIDRGGAIKGNKLDLFFPTHEAALQWGRQHLDVVVMD